MTRYRCCRSRLTPKTSKSCLYRLIHSALHRLIHLALNQRLQCLQDNNNNRLIARCRRSSRLQNRLCWSSSFYKLFLIPRVHIGHIRV
ncbi:hypothetical protein SDJN03_25979, partial [Cucurbita argyrosperma subsp. sororia]